MDIYVQKDGQKHGPFSEDHIRRGIDAGEFNADDPAWTQGKASWQPLFDLIRLDVMQPPPIPASVTTANVAGLSESSSVPPPFVDRGEPIPVVEGRWKRQHNCKKCDAPFRTFTVGTLKATDICDACTRKRSRVMGFCFAASVIAIFIIGVVIDRNEQYKIAESQSNLSSLVRLAPDGKSFLPAFKSHATPNDNVFLFPSSTPVPITNDDGKLKMRRLGAGPEPMVFPTIPPLAESPTPTQSFSADERHVGLRKSEAVFLAAYGKSRGSYPAPPPEPAGAKVEWFYEAGLYYMALFWNDIAQGVLVIRKDGRELSDEDIRIALNEYADGETWRSAPSTDASVIKHWERNGAVANLGKRHDNGGSRAANNPDQFLQIATAEYTQQFDPGR